MITIYHQLLALLCILTLPLGSLAESINILTVNEPPSSYLDEQGNIDGFSVDIVRAIQQRIESTDEIKIVPEERAIWVASKEPNTLIFGFSRTPEREGRFHWITQLIRKDWTFYSKAESRITINDINKAKTANKIAVVRGDIRGKYLEKLGFNNLVKTNTHEHSLRLLLHNRVELFFSDPQAVAYSLRNIGLSMDVLKQNITAQQSDVYLLMSKKGTHADVVKKWKQGAQDIKKDGTFQKIAERWSKIIAQQTGLNPTISDGMLKF